MPEPMPTPEFVAEEFKRLGAIPARVTWEDIKGEIYACPIGVLTGPPTDDIKWFDDRRLLLQSRYGESATFWGSIAMEWDGRNDNFWNLEDKERGVQFARDLIAALGQKPIDHI